MPLTVDIRKTLRTAERQFTLDVSFTASAQRMVLFGPSGAGKSLTLQAIAGLLRPDEGSITLHGDALFDSARGIDQKPQARRLAYLFQDWSNTVFVDLLHGEDEVAVSEALAIFAVCALDSSHTNGDDPLHERELMGSPK